MARGREHHLSVAIQVCVLRSNNVLLRSPTPERTRLCPLPLSQHGQHVPEERLSRAQLWSQTGAAVSPDGARVGRDTPQHIAAQGAALALHTRAERRRWPRGGQKGLLAGTPHVGRGVKPGVKAGSASLRRLLIARMLVFPRVGSQPLHSVWQEIELSKQVDK